MGLPKKQRSCRLDLTILQKDAKGVMVPTIYHVKPIASAWHPRSYQFRKDDGTCYVVAQDISGKVDCDCGAAIFNDQSCKHAKCGRRAGLFLSPVEIQALRWYAERNPVKR